MTVCVELDRITKAYGRKEAVRDVDLVLRPGECVALAGHNGAGKSTLIKLMLGLITPTRGKISVLGRTPAAGGRADVGYLPESLALYPGMTGVETLAFYAKLKGQPVAHNAALLQRVGIADAAGYRVGTYSKGMRQRLGLAQALLGSPQLLLLDEPTAGLDPALRQSFYEILGELRERGVTVVLSSHALAEVEGRADRIVIMNGGRKCADGSMSDLRNLAALRTRIRLRLAHSLRLIVNDGHDRLAGWKQVGEGAYELECSEQEKVAVIGRLGTLGVPIQDVEIISPGLDDLYAYFLERESA